MFFHLHKRRLTESEAKLYFAEIVLTFEYLHEQKVVYRDLKVTYLIILAIKYYDRFLRTCQTY